MYENLISDIRAAIKANGNQEITGPILQDVLVGIVNALGAGVPCGGVLSPGDTPAPQQPIFYLAGPGTYNAAGLTTVGEGCIGLTIFDGSSWSADTIDTGLAGEVSTINDALATINATLLNKMDKVPLAIENRFPQFNSSGGVKDGGFEPVEHISKDDATNKHLPTEKAVREALTGKQELLVAGAADGILGPSAATGLAQVLTAPSAGVSIVDAIKGRTLVWNQLSNRTATPSVSGDTTHVSATRDGNKLKIVVSDTITTLTQIIFGPNVTGLFKTGHTYFFYTNPSNSLASYMGYNDGHGCWWQYIGSSYVSTGGSKTFTTDDNMLSIIYIGTAIPAGTYDLEPVCFDITKMFDQNDAPSSLAQFSMLFSPRNKPYNAGTLLPFKGAGLKVTGFNQWDEQWEKCWWDETSGGVKRMDNSAFGCANYIPVLGGKNYYAQNPVPGSGYFYILYYDANKAYISVETLRGSGAFTTPAKAAYITFYSFNYGTTYNHDICINLSNAALNGTYKPYTETLVNIDAIGKTAKDADGNAIVPFPTGVNGVGTAFDEYGREGGKIVFASYTIKPTDTWALVGTNQWNCKNILTGCGPTGSAIISSKGDSTQLTNGASFPEGVSVVLPSTITTATQAAEYMAGAEVIYILATPVPFTWDEPFTLAFTAEEGGTIWLQPEGVDEAGVPATAPMNLDISYTTPAVSIITETTLRNMLNQFKAAGKIASYTMTPDGNGNFNFTIS